MKDDFEKAATSLKDKAVLADLDATEEKEIAEKWGIRGFPTLKVFSNGEFLQDYKGGRDEKSIVEFMERANEPAFTTYETAEEVKKFVEENDKVVRIFGVALDEETEKTFRKVVLQTDDSVGSNAAFAAVKDAALVKEYMDVPAGSFILLKTKDDDSEVIKYEGESDGLVDWVKTEATPAFGKITPANAGVYVDAAVPLFVVFSDTEDLDADVNTVMGTVAKSLKEKAKGKLSFVWTDKSLATFRDHVGLKDKDPAVCIYSFDGDSKFIYPGEKITEDGIKSFAEDYLDGKIKPILKSEPIPEDNDEPVKVVVGDSWADVVEDENKDVLIEQYAPWCGHCKKLTPIYDDLASTLESVETIVIAKMDATANDAPPEHKASGFPTIKFFPAGGKDPVDYKGGRDKESFIKFLQEHATHKFEVPEADEADEEDDGKEDL